MFLSNIEDLAVSLSPNQCARLSIKSDFSVELSVLRVESEGKMHREIYLMTYV